MKYLQLFEEYIKKEYGKSKTYKDNFIKAMNIMTLEECVKYVIENCTEFIDNPIAIVRKIDTSLDDEISYFQSDPVQRISRDNANHYTLLIDNSEEWKEYPKRSKSFCCTLLPKKTYYTNKYLVIPNDNSKWGICQSDDLYYSFNNLRVYADSIKRFFNFINDFSIELGLGGISDDNINDMKEDILKLQNKIFTEYDKKTFIYDINQEYAEYCSHFEQGEDNPLQFYEDYWNKNLFEVLIELIAPDNNNFNLKKYSELDRGQHEQEIWTDSPCIFVYDKYITLFINILRDKIKKEILL